ncbi:TVP38/TMEM64 family protein [Microvirga pakistanensis]|uniref:TVP38/TMEM64 family protein n=1 Tax=Microvirga pakistanensis TaxID=1682650 RepID=UPI00106B451A|nr:TVP38/TMEM64 family protein [Microvirga pakistanensis]
MSDRSDKSQGVPAGRNLWRYLPLAILVIVVGVFFGAGLQRSISFETFLSHEAELRRMVAEHRLAMLGSYVLVYVAAVTLSLPVSAILTVIGGYLFGWLLGGVVASLAATLGATSIFMIARTSLGQPLLKRAGTRVQRLAAGFQRQAFSYLLFLRLMPVMPFWLTNLAAAFFGMRLRSYAVATYVGMLPVSFAFAFAGAGLDKAIAGHEKARQQCLAAGQANCVVDFDPSSLLEPEVMGALSILGILALAPVVIRYRRTRGRGGKRQT